MSDHDIHRVACTTMLASIVVLTTDETAADAEVDRIAAEIKHHVRQIRRAAILLKDVSPARTCKGGYPGGGS